MSHIRGNLAAAKRELAERQDEANLCMVELKHAQEIMAAGGTGSKVLSVSWRHDKERGREENHTVEREGEGSEHRASWSVCTSWWFNFFSLCDLCRLLTSLGIVGGATARPLCVCVSVCLSVCLLFVTTPHFHFSQPPAWLHR